MELDFANDHARMRVFIAPYEYLRDADLRTLFNLIRETPTRAFLGLRGQVFHRGMELSVGKALIVIKCQHVVAVAGDI